MLKALIFRIYPEAQFPSIACESLLEQHRPIRFLPARRYASAATSYGPVSVCLCLSQVGVLSKRMNESSWFLLWELPFTVLKRYSCISKNKGASLWNFVPNSGLRKFLHVISIVETYYQLTSRKADAQSVINWTVVGQLS